MALRVNWQTSQKKISGALRMSKKNMISIFRAIFSMAFYVGLFSGIGYLIQLTLL
jgi:hypothetical protein